MSAATVPQSDSASEHTMYVGKSFESTPNNRDWTADAAARAAG